MVSFSSSVRKDSTRTTGPWPSGLGAVRSILSRLSMAGVLRKEGLIEKTFWEITAAAVSGYRKAFPRLA